MKKIIVTTDFSANAKAGILFALNLSALGGFKLIFYYGMDMQKPISWNENRYNEYILYEKKRQEMALKKYLTQIYKKKKLCVTTIEYVVEIGYNLEETLIAYAQKINADFICMSTRGAGVIKKLFGSTACKLVTTSPIPLMIVPNTYRAKPIKNIWYASDLENLDSELAVANEFAKYINTKLTVLNYYSQGDEEKNKKIEAISIAKYFSCNIEFQLKKLIIGDSLTQHLKHDLKKNKPSLLILFTKQNRDWFERIFLSSDSVDLTFDTKIPLIIFRKK